jgi:hypothetical protein
MALVFLLIGGLATYAQGMMQSARGQNVSRLNDQSVVQAIKDENDIDVVRKKALYYSDLALGIQKRRYEEADQKYYDARLLSFFVAGVFLLGAGMVFFLRKDGDSGNAPSDPNEST